MLQCGNVLVNRLLKIEGMHLAVKCTSASLVNRKRGDQSQDRGFEESYHHDPEW